MSVHRCRSAGRVFVALLLLGLITVAGCGTGRLRTYYVIGTVMVNNAPAEGAIVVFCPVDPGPELMNLRPAGKTDASGQFKLTTFNPMDGAPAGNYKIIVKWPSAAPPRQGEDRPAAVNKGPDQLKGKYYNLDTTPLTATVEKGSNNLPPFNLQSK